MHLTSRNQEGRRKGRLEGGKRREGRGKKGRKGKKKGRKKKKVRKLGKKKKERNFLKRQRKINYKKFFFTFCIICLVSKYILSNQINLLCFMWSLSVP